ncbi:TetR/AcrR family transcriptional regulator C-terminal domain-containing protein [Actinoplanes sp. TRM 88003]|uniref:TetR/AcrR family transcriptional regulator C-terminal domain-containing protein n=1 Tax=Paractinoplanes aksuensis TaxID=2939490 RepID=A0ABT1DKG9_9ACTN|nr:TetR/AcrR family transcriptional regulator C-terminal domain-containing protein [Actinoplanes aksuensis]MCO8271339.1 TetR/AcrR family transcriptional regulator C-terminal domain-containing protein [Actinoplanes aksuensis]
MKAAGSKTPDERRADEIISIWLRDEASPSRPSPLTRERIVNEAVKLLDQHGVNGLTMRRLAEGMDVTATALYWHVRIKEDVLDLALDHIFGEVPIPDSTADWRGDVRRLVRNWRAVMLRHPWAPSLIGRPVLGPRVLARTEYLQSALVRGGLTDLDLAVSTRLLANYVIGAALTEGVSRQGADPRTSDIARRHITRDSAAYPVINASGHLDTGRWNDDDLFDRGLDAILAGLPHRDA